MRREVAKCKSAGVRKCYARVSKEIMPKSPFGGFRGGFNMRHMNILDDNMR